MTVRRSGLQGPGLVRRALDGIRLSGLIAAGGRTHNFSATDLPWEDVYCPRCRRRFAEGDELVLVVTRLDAAQIFTVPMHRRACVGGEG